MRRRPLLWLAFAAVPCVGASQDLNSLLRGGIEVLQREGKVAVPPGTPIQADPLEPAGHPGLPPKTQQLPPPRSATQRLEIVQIGGETHYVGQRFQFTGGVHLRYRGYDIFADQIEGSTQTNIFTATGNVRLIGQDAVVTGERVTVNFDDRTFRSENSDAQLRPSFLEGRVLDDVYLTGGVAYGSEREVWGEAASLTTCNLDHPHYLLNAARANVRPGRRMILRRVDLVVLNRKILSIPYVSIPLDNAEDRYMPEIGQSPDEGYYIKNRIGVPLRRDDGLVARLDYMTKLGTGLGGDYRYGQEFFNTLGAYAVLGAINTFNFQNDHSQRIGSGVLRLENNLQRNNYLNAPENTILRTQGTYSLDGPRSNSLFVLSRNSNETGAFRTLTQNLALSDNRSWGTLRTAIGQRDRNRIKTNINFVQNTSGAIGGTDVKREQIDVNLSAQHQMTTAEAFLDYTRSIPVGETTNFFSPTDKTPHLGLRSSSERLFGRDFNNRFLSFNTELSVGEFVSRTSEQVTRTNFDFTFNRRGSSLARSTLNVNGRFRQGMYSDDTAQYVAGVGIDYRYRLGGDTSANIRYNFLRPYGFTPLSIDRVGRTNFLSGDVSFRPFRSLRIGAQSGYDFLREAREEIAWQTAGIRAEYTPTNWFQFRAYTTYDPTRHAFNNVLLDFVYLPGATQILGSFRYDGIRHTWGNANIRINGLKWGRLLVSSMLSYNGYLKKFEARHFSFTYDLHCAEAILQIIDNPTGFRSGREIAFFLRLKAFPFDTPFGAGRRGQPVGIGSGYPFSGGG